MKVKQYMKTVMEYVIWADVVQVMDHSSIPSGMRGEVGHLLAQHGLTREEVVPMATHSWGGRDWKKEEGATPLFLEDPCHPGNGWHLFREEEVKYLECDSATSGSMLEAEETHRGWRVTLTVPVANGTPYYGVYAEAFDRVALRLDEGDERWEALVEEFESRHGEDAWQSDHEPEEVVGLPEGLDGPWGWEAIASASGYTAWRRPRPDEDVMYWEEESHLYR